VAEWTITVAAPRVAAVPPPEPPALVPPPRLVRAPGPRYLEGRVGEPLVFQTRVEPQSTTVVYRWTVDRRWARARAPGRLEYEPTVPGRHTVRVTVTVADQTIGRDTWVVTVPEPEVAEVTPPRVGEPAPPGTETAPPSVPSELAEAEVRAWLDEYARAWSRKDLRALRRMGQVRSAAEESSSSGTSVPSTACTSPCACSRSASTARARRSSWSAPTP